MEISFAAERRLLEFSPGSKSEKILLEDFPGFLRPRGSGKFFIPNCIPIIQNVIRRLKARYTKPIDCPKEIAEVMRNPIKLLPLPEDFSFHTTPFEHQHIALRYLYTLGSAGLLLDPGLGKTKIVLDYIKLMKFKKSLIVCPRSLLFVWEDETITHQPGLKTYVLESTSWMEQIESARTAHMKWSDAVEGGELSGDELVRAKANRSSAARRLNTLPEKMAREIELAREADIIVVNYDKVSNGYDFLAKTLGVTFDFIAVDEALIKDPKSKRTVAVTKLGAQIPYRVIMSGTLVNNSPMDAFAPLRFLQPGLVGLSYSRFETYYGHMVKIKGTGRQFLAGISKANTIEIRELLDACCIVMDKNVWLKDLPQKQFFVHNVSMTREQEDAMNDLAANYACNVQGVMIEATTPLTAMAKMYQIANGFLYHYPDAREDIDLDILLLGGNDGYGIYESEYPEQILYGDTEEAGRRDILPVGGRDQTNTRRIESIRAYPNGNNEGSNQHSGGHADVRRGQTQVSQSYSHSRSSAESPLQLETGDFFSGQVSSIRCGDGGNGTCGLRRGHGESYSESTISPGSESLHASSAACSISSSQGEGNIQDEGSRHGHGHEHGPSGCRTHIPDSRQSCRCVDSSYTSSTPERQDSGYADISAGIRVRPLSLNVDVICDARASSGNLSDDNDGEGHDEACSQSHYDSSSSFRSNSYTIDSDDCSRGNPTTSRSTGLKSSPDIQYCPDSTSGNPGRRVVLRFSDSCGLSSKSRELARLIGGDLSGRKVLIWYNLSQEYLDILEGLRAAGASEDEISVIKGGTKSTGDIVRRFNKDPSKRYLICQAQAVNYGITVLGTNPEALEKDGVYVLPDFDVDVYTHVFYSLGFSLERFLQQQDRSHRIGLKRSPEYHILLSDCQFERYIHSMLKNKVDIRESVLVDVFNRLKNLM